ncbi:endo-1,4-beta-xylanase [Glycomyces sp. TRM65418]|uniref:endo-1,4-beta-xylanase n=1 Tax=Glycomyces sp. TRM65418 TaxID=2867006 RepID=UPI001CE5DCE1|nr:endo-1,4-beta-xylanase [Glycomyces sp. TRM65418]MCC3765352.1 endo-1,4-beta-xylanase [Glycomyces sp. TRM65418]QZD54969.1 endo-1,4-beta-xylanase [Glycomyces sp. TRM65418]
MTETSDLRHRSADAEITLTLDGEPLAGREVELSQVRHRFSFGCTAFEFTDYANGTSERPDGDERLLEQWEGLFNFATLPFYWGRFEPERGKPDTHRLLKTAEWLVGRGHTVKGHPLAWHTVTADWLLDLDNAAIAQAQTERIRREMNDFAGVIDMWDVINEVVIMPIFDKYDNGITRLCRDIGRIPMVRMVFDAAREANPGAVLLLNDFDMSAAFECLIEGVLEAGVRIDALGLQSHMHQGYWGEEKTLGILDRFSRYGLPIHFTETTLLSGHLMPPEIEDLNDYQIEEWPSTPEGEERQADEVERHYRTLVAHPAVEAITYWGMSDAGMWLGAPGGFVRADGTPKPSYERLHRLINEEWGTPPTTIATDAEGRLGCNGFLGDYTITWQDREAAFTLDAAGEQRLTLELG